MVAHNPSLVYLSAGTVALHLHNYGGWLWMGDEMVRLRPGDFTLTPPQVPSHYDLDEPGQHLCVHFEAATEAEPSVALPLHWRPGTHERWLRERLQEIIHLHRRSEAGGAAGELARHAAGAALQGLLLWLALATGGNARPSKQAERGGAVLDDVRRHLEENYRKPLVVPAVARKFGLSQNYLARQFRRRHGMTMQRYVMALRVEFARHLLTVTQLPLKAIAVEAGLSNPQYFHRQFRRATGHSPSEERAWARPPPTEP